jgi:hypothetical protein
MGMQAAGGFGPTAHRLRAIESIDQEHCGARELVFSQEVLGGVN